MAWLDGLIQVANLGKGLPRFSPVFFGERFFFLVESAKHLLALLVTVCVELDVFAGVHSVRHNSYPVVCGGLSHIVTRPLNT